MRSYTCIVDRRSDGSWIAYFPALAEIPPIQAASKKIAKRRSFRALISYLLRCDQQGRPLPKDRSTTYFHRVDVNRLHQYENLEGDPMSYDLR